MGFLLKHLLLSGILSSWDSNVSSMSSTCSLRAQVTCFLLFLLCLSLFRPLFLSISFPSSFSSTLMQNADKLYKGQLSEFTPLASLHAPSKAGGRRRGSGNQRNAPNPRRSEPFSKKIMFTRWQRTPDYCTFTPLLRFTDGARHSKQGHAYSGAGPETSV